MREETGIYKRLKETAKKRGIKLKDIGKKAGVSDRMVFAWRYNVPRAENLAKVADALGVTTDYLMNGTTQKSLERNNHELEWYDLGMGFGGKVPDELKHIYKEIGEKYIQEHPDKFELTETK